MYEDDFNVKEAVNEILEDMRCVCDFRSHYKQWDDLGASAVEAFLENYNNSQLTDVVEYMLSYIRDIYDSEKASHNKAIGIKAALSLALSEMYDSLGYVGIEITEEDRDKYGDEITDRDNEISDRLRCIRLNLEDVKELKFEDE